jgi:hypothetical protein
VHRVVGPGVRRQSATCSARRTWLAYRAALSACQRNATSNEVTRDAWYWSSIARLVAVRASEETTEEKLGSAPSKKYSPTR